MPVLVQRIRQRCGDMQIVLVRLLFPYLHLYWEHWLNLFTWLGILLTIGLALVPTKYWQVLLLVYIGSIIGYSGGNLFYDSFLIDVADNKQMDRVSSTGYGMGYLGGVVAFIIFLVAELSKGFGGLLSSYGVARFSFILAAVW